MQKSRRIDPETIIFPPTYITNCSRLAIRIVNEEDTILRGEWRKYSNPHDEYEFQNALDVGDPIVRAKFKDSLYFSSDNFQIEPISCEVWPRRSQQLVVTFSPSEVGDFCETAFFTDFESNQRISFVMRGTALPPMARFNIDQINVGHVLLDSICEYCIKLENIGNVSFDFQLDPQKPMSRANSSLNTYRYNNNEDDENLNQNTISFSPESGTVIGNCSVPIIVKLVANHVGQIDNTFNFSIVGVDCYKPSICITGRVLGPSFKVDRHSVDFGMVSFGFLFTETFEIANESQIPFEYSLHFAKDGSFECREFNVVPASGTIPKFGKQKVNIEFIPIRIQDYSVKLLLDAPKFDGLLFTMPITARCICPEVSIQDNEIDLGEIFIGNRREASVTLVDNTDFPAKFEFLDCSNGDASNVLEATVEFIKPRGIIGAHHHESYPFVVTPLQLGFLKFTRFIRISGSDLPPLPFTVTAMCRGPNIMISNTEVSFGIVNVLEDVYKEISITNDSLISSHYNATFANDNSYVFDVDPVECDIQAGETKKVKIMANLNDVGLFKGRLILTFQHLTPMTVELSAKGVGSTLVPSIDMSKIDFGFVFIGQSAKCHFSLENRGRRPQEIKWSFQKSKKDEEEKYPIIKKIVPDSVTINKNEIAHFDLIVESTKPKPFSFVPQCHYTLNRQRTELFNPLVEGTFIQPMIEIKEKSMSFKYVHDVQKEELISGSLASKETITPSKSLLVPIIKQNEIKNLSALPLHITTSCPPNFTISPDEFQLEPTENTYFEVTFDPSYKTTFSSEAYDTQIKFFFTDSAQYYLMKIHNEMIFPNLSFEPSSSIDFGILMIHTEETKHIKVKNTSSTNCEFYWELLLNNQTECENRIFDIYPIRGSIACGEQVDIHITFFAGDGEKVDGCCKFSCTAICHVIGGPEYAIELNGASAAIDYHISPKSIDFGQIDCSTPVNGHFSLSNTSEVPINYKVKIPKNGIFKMISINPRSGTAQIGETTEFTLVCIFGVPKIVKTTFFIEIGHFNDVQIDLSADCYFPQLAINIPRFANVDQTLEYMEKNGIKDSISAERSLMVEKLSASQKKSINVSPSSLFSHLKIGNSNNNNNNHLNSIRKFDGFVLSTFIVDFGQIILGENKSISFDLSSITPFPISFEVLDQSLNETGFVITPTSFRDIPTNENLQITFSFDTQKRKKEILGRQIFYIPLVFKSDLGYMIVIQAKIVMPTLIFSKTHFEFDATILGQSRVQTLQLQNIEDVSCEFKIEQAQFISNNKNNSKSNTSRANHKNVFLATPSQGILPPSSFVNIEIVFSPLQEKNYSMQFPITLKHSKNPTLISLKGSGVQMKLLFDPPNIVFPPIQELSEPSQTTVDLINPSNYPINVFSPQFDFELLINSLNEKRNFYLNCTSSMNLPTMSSANSPSTNSAKPTTANDSNKNTKNINNNVSDYNNNKNGIVHEISFSTFPKVSKFSVCVIVHGPPKSGRTTVSRAISEYLGGIPVINLRNFWEHNISLPANNISSSDYISSFKELISKKEYNKGFVIDGLDAFPETSEGESFLVHFLKQKNTQEELQKNPFTVLSHSSSTSNETTLSYVLAALDGHYVFQIALNANETALIQHQALNENDEVSRNQNNSKKQLDDLFKMSENDYEKLTDEEKKEVDTKREYYRKYLIQHGDGASDLTAEKSVTSRTNRGFSKDRDKTGNKRPKAKNLPSDPFLLSVMLFQYTFGRICDQVSSGANFISLDSSPKNEQNTNNSTNNQSDNHIQTSNKDQQTTTNNNNNRSRDQHNRKNNNNNNPKIVEEDQNQIVNSISSKNNLLVDATLPIDSVLKEIYNFLPEIHHLKEKAFTQLIPRPKLVLPDDSLIGSPTLMNMPEYFRILNDEPPGIIPQELAYYHYLSLLASAKALAIKNNNSNSNDIENCSTNGTNITTSADLINLMKSAKSVNLNVNDENDLSKLTNIINNQISSKNINLISNTNIDSSLNNNSNNADDDGNESPQKNEFGYQEIDVNQYTKRWRIEANSRITLKLQFNVTKQGEYSNKLLFGVCDCRNDLFRLPVSGVCERPDINRDPKLVFGKVVNSPDIRSSLCFVQSTKEYMFGSLLISKEKISRNFQGLYKQELNLANTTSFPVELSANLTESGPKSAWTIDNTNLVINPSGKGNITIWFNPNSIDKFKNVLSICVKDNPEPFVIPITGDGCCPQVEVSTTNIDFEKLLLKQQRTMKLIIKNTGKIISCWRIKGGIANLGNNFTISSTEGSLLPSKSCSLDISFTSSKPIVVKKTIQIDVLDQNKTRTFNSNHINISAESFDVAFDFTFPKNLTHLAFGCVKVDQVSKLTCFLRNKGKYPTKYKITFDGSSNNNNSLINKDKTPPLKSILTIDEPEGVVPTGEKGVNITFSLLLHSTLKLNSIKGLNLHIIDSGSNEETAVFPIPVSCESVYSNYSIEPKENLVSFGTSSLNTNVTQELKIVNNGVFAFDFEILPKIEIVPPSGYYGNGVSNGYLAGGSLAVGGGANGGRSRGRNLGKKLKGNSNNNNTKKLPPISSPSPKNKKRSSGKEFSIGYFTVAVSAGSVAPGTSFSVPIIFNSPIDGLFTNTILVKIGDSEPTMDSCSEGKAVQLSANCIVPGILTSDYEKIFPGQHLCLRYDIAKNDTTSAFLEDEQIFHFLPTVLNNRCQIDIALVNPHPIQCTVDLSIKPKDKSSSTHFPFELSEKSLNVLPKSSSIVVLAFCPTAVNKFLAVFEGTVRGGTDQKTKVLKFGVEGAGALPSITLLPQTEMTRTRSTIVNFGKTLVGLKKEKNLTVMNDGLIPCFVTIKSISKVPDFGVVFNGNNNNNNYNNTTHIHNNINNNIDDSDSTDHANNNENNSLSSTSGNGICKELLLAPNRQQSFQVVYEPQNLKKGQFHITIDARDNPSSGISLTFIGEGFSEDVIFEGTTTSGEDNDIAFKDNVVGQRQQVTFMMHNVSSNNVRFAWSNSSDFSFSPRVGHLKNHSRKEITATYLTEKPTKYDNFKVFCQWSKIEYTVSDPPDWDDSMQQVSFVQRNMLSCPTNSTSTATNSNFSSNINVNCNNNDNINNNNSNNMENSNNNNNKNVSFKDIDLIRSRKMSVASISASNSKNIKSLLKNNSASVELTETSVVFVSSKGPEFDLIKVVEIKPEPLFEMIPGKLKDIILKVSAISDHIKYEIDTNEIEFAPTMMYETRISTLTMKNTSQIRFEYSWNTKLFGSLRTDYAQTRKSPFSVEPNSGFIEPDETTTFRVLFSPEEVDDFTANLICEIPHLSQKPNPEVYVTGRSRRPICHFNLETSDYISAGRRHPDYTEIQLPEGVKVIELFSKGIGQKTTKKFEIINTTEAPYEILWNKKDESSQNSSESYNNNNCNNAIICELPRSMISSGKRHTAAFSYVPSSVKTIESMWEFKIPEYGVTIPLLIVGRIMPH